MKICVIGAGNVGRTLGMKWADAGHEVVFGVRDLTSPKVIQLLSEGSADVKVLPIPDGLAEGDIILLAIPHGTVTEFSKTYTELLANKLIIDATNHFTAETINNFPALQANVPSATLVRAFNSQGWDVFAKPMVNEVKADHFYCCPEEAQAQMAQLIAEIGLNPIYLGGDEALRMVDALGLTWITLAIRQDRGRNLTLNILQE
jgi:predicted dinucleotide-binding enzyme